MGESRVHLGIDIGGTKTAIVAERADGVASSVHRMPSAIHQGGMEHAARAHALARATLAEIDCSDEPIAIGIGVPGPLDRTRGVLLDQPTLRWGDEFDLRGAFARHWPTAEIVIDNDCNAGALGELTRGAARGCLSCCYFGIGTGVGGCIIVDGNIVHGASGNAGELGHVRVAESATPCVCGESGCLDQIASGWAIAQRCIDAGIELAELRGARGRGVPEAAAILDDASTALGRAIATILNVLSPEIVVIGGGVVMHQPELVDAAARLARHAAFGPSASSSRIVVAQLGHDSAAWGALTMAQRAG